MSVLNLSEPFQNILYVVAPSVKVRRNLRLLKYRTTIQSYLACTHYTSCDFQKVWQSLNLIYEDYDWSVFLLKQFRTLVGLLRKVTCFGAIWLEDDTVPDLIRRSIRMLQCMCRKILLHFKAVLGSPDNRFKSLEVSLDEYKEIEVKLSAGDLYYFVNVSMIKVVVDNINVPMPKSIEAVYEICRNMQTFNEFDRRTNVRDLIAAEIQHNCSDNQLRLDRKMTMLDSELETLFKKYVPIKEAWIWTLLRLVKLKEPVPLTSSRFQQLENDDDVRAAENFFADAMEEQCDRFLKKLNSMKRLLLPFFKFHQEGNTDLTVDEFERFCLQAELEEPPPQADGESSQTMFDRTMFVDLHLNTQSVDPLLMSQAIIRRMNAGPADQNTPHQSMLSESNVTVVPVPFVENATNPVITSEEQHDSPIADESQINADAAITAVNATDNAVHDAGNAVSNMDISVNNLDEVNAVLGSTRESMHTMYDEEAHIIPDSFTKEISVAAPETILGESAIKEEPEANNFSSYENDVEIIELPPPEPETIEDNSQEIANWLEPTRAGNGIDYALQSVQATVSTDAHTQEMPLAISFSSQNRTQSAPVAIVEPASRPAEITQTIEDIEYTEQQALLRKRTLHSFNVNTKRPRYANVHQTPVPRHVFGALPLQSDSVRMQKPNVQQTQSRPLSSTIPGASEPQQINIGQIDRTESCESISLSQMVVDIISPVLPGPGGLDANVEETESIPQVPTVVEKESVTAESHPIESHAESANNTIASTPSSNGVIFGDETQPDDREIFGQFGPLTTQERILSTSNSIFLSSQLQTASQNSLTKSPAEPTAVSQDKDIRLHYTLQEFISKCATTPYVIRNKSTVNTFAVTIEFNDGELDLNEMYTEELLKIPTDKWDAVRQLFLSFRSFSYNSTDDRPCVGDAIEKCLPYLWKTCNPLNTSKARQSKRLLILDQIEPLKKFAGLWLNADC